MRLGAVPLGRDSGLAYYRILIPMRKMTQRNEEIKPIIKFSEYMNNIDETEIEELDAMGEICDVIILQRRYGERWLNMVHSWQSQGCKVVYEIDDVYEKIPLVNIRPSYREMCKPDTTKAVCKIMDACDYVSVSTFELGLWVIARTDKSAKKILLLKNTLDLDMWPAVEREKSDAVMIGYSGAEQHVIDLPELGGCLHEMYIRHGDAVEFGFMGFMTKDMWNLTEAGVYFKKGEPFLQYPAVLSSLGFDIGLAPLKSCFFNECKSELKYLEYSAMGIPTIASDIAPYERAIGRIDREDPECRGILIRNKPRKFLSALEYLFKNPERRKEIGAKARKYVEENYNIDLYVERWLDTYNRIAKGEV